MEAQSDDNGSKRSLTQRHMDVPADHEAALQEQGGQKKLVRLYDATDVDLDRQAPNSVKLFDCNETSQLTVPLETGDRDYISELGYTTSDNRWLKLARSPRVHIPPLPSINTAALGGVAAAGIAGLRQCDRLTRVNLLIQRSLH